MRTAEEYAQGHVPGALIKPLDQLDRMSSDLSKQIEIYLICRSGMRSQQAEKILAEQGFTHLINIEGGTMAWLNAGHPVDFNKG